MSLDRFDDAQETRQAIMDYCNRIGGAHKHRDVAMALWQADKNQVEKCYRAFKAMVRDNEATCRKEGREFLWTVTATRTLTAAEMRERAARKSKGDNGRAILKSKGAWHTVNRCCDFHDDGSVKHPIHNHGGQGRVNSPLTGTYLEVCL